MLPAFTVCLSELFVLNGILSPEGSFEFFTNLFKMAIFHLIVARGVGSGGRGGRLPLTFQSGGEKICIPPPFWHGKRLKPFCANFIRYVVLLKLETCACHSIFGSVNYTNKFSAVLPRFLFFAYASISYWLVLF